VNIKGCGEITYPETKDVEYAYDEAHNLETVTA
jgi:hypothetical protein